MKNRSFFLDVTERNRDLITEKEQYKMKKTVVAFFGLSVGSHAALTWMMQSRADIIIIADPDIIEFSNLNRIGYGSKSVGRKKTGEMKAKLAEINPSAKILSFDKTEENDIKSIFSKNNVDFIVEEVDNLGAKILLRKIASKKMIPLLNATDVGNNVFMDIERYDLRPQPKPFLGRVDISNIDFSNLDRKQIIKLAVKIVGLKYNSLRMLDSLSKIGKTIKTWPQLGATATISGGVITTAITKIVCGESVKSGRYIISLDNIFGNPDKPSDLKKAENKIRSILDI